jgi:phosphatidylserine/phosphatidylglycerophosphate/cardiolipin synthase-like enzyme
MWGSLTLVCISLATAAQAASGWVEVGEAPTTDLALTLRAIESAQKTLKINAYELTSTEIATAIRARILAGVQVDILQEAEPVPSFPAAGVPIRTALVAAIRRMGAGSYREMEGRKEGVRRFPYDHAKYMIVDDSSVLVGSENYSPTGQAEPGTKGNRGWEVFIHDAGTAADFETVFSGDRNKTHKDITEVVGFDKLAEWFLAAPGAGLEVGEEAFVATEPTVSADQPAFQASRIVPVVSPDTSLTSLVALIRSARRTLDIQQLNFDSDWDKVTNASPILAEVIAASRRGVQVRVLLNDDASSFGGDPETSHNTLTVAALNRSARQLGARLEGRIANLKAMGVDYIHNKGVLVDGYLTLVSSINWNQNSITRNREAGVLLTGPEINAHYSALFNSDWAASQ